MKKLTLSFLSVSLMAMMPVIAGAAGTYYNGNLYQSPQRYGANGGGYYNNYGAGQYGQNQSMVVRNTTTRVTKKAATKQQNDVAAPKQGLRLGAYFTHEFANWDFEMKEAGSKLRYDGVAWNVISGEGAYYFDTSTPMQIKFGARYGKQFGETSMSDDDITNGAYGSASQYGGMMDGYAVSLGTSKDGTQYGFNVAFGLTDFFTLGRAKITPSVGYRYFKHKLITKNNSGLTMDVYREFCESVENGETQCQPFVGLVPFYDSQGNIIYVTQEDGSEVPHYMVLSGGEYSIADLISGLNSVSGAESVYLNLGDTYYYRQNGSSHEYETVWAGPYIALDMEYEINNNNLINMGIEFGLPTYESKGNQPYRIDWQHPTSVEDKGKFGDAYHLGLNAMWSTSVTDNVMLSFGVTYDYYKVKDAEAKTYLNPSYYKLLLDTGYMTQEDYDFYSSKGFVLDAKSEIKSVYSAMGMRLGVSVKF